jgi:hypothetical protein
MNKIFVKIQDYINNKSTQINELFDGNLSLDNKIELIKNTILDTEFSYTDPNTDDEYQFFFMKEDDSDEYRFLFSINDSYGLTNKNIQYKILTVMYKCIGMFIDLKPNVNKIIYTIDINEEKRKNVYNSIFLKYGFKEKESYIGKLSNNKAIMVKLEK